MTYFLLNIMLALVWVFVTGQFTPANLAVGFVVGYVMLFLTRRVIGPTAYFHKLWQGISFFFFSCVSWWRPTFASQSTCSRQDRVCSRA